MQYIIFRAMRFYLGVDKYTPTAAFAGDMGWIPADVKQWDTIYSYWYRIFFLGKHTVFLWLYTSDTWNISLIIPCPYFLEETLNRDPSLYNILFVKQKVNFHVKTFILNKKKAYDGAYDTFHVREWTSWYNTDMRDAWIRIQH